MAKGYAFYKVLIAFAEIRGKRDLWLPRNIFDEQVFDLTYPFRMNKFGRAMEEDFETVRDAIHKIIGMAHRRARSTLIKEASL